MRQYGITNFQALASAPSSPAAGDTYFNTGDLRTYAYNGTIWVALNAIETYVFSVTGTVAVATGKSRLYTEQALTLETVRAAVNTAPTGATLICDVNKNGTTVFTTQANRPTIAISGNSALSGAAQVTAFAAGDYITVDVDQIGSTVAGADLTVTVRLRAL